MERSLKDVKFRWPRRTSATPSRDSEVVVSQGLRPWSGGADRIVVIDTETTGLFTNDRIVEVAAVTMNLDGDVVEVWETLVHPGRDVSATEIHGITASMVATAPRFDEIAGDLALRLNGACLAGHNLPFDLRMLSAEYERLGTNLAMVAGLDTLSAVRCRLGEACDQYGITHLGEHSGAGDALATAELLTRVVDRCEPGAPAVAPTGLKRSGRTLRRGDTTAEPTSDPPFIIRLIAAASDPAEELNKLQYRSLLEIALADLHLDRSERFQLQSLAAELGFSMAEAALEHRRFVDELVAEAISDHEVTEEEHDALVRVASALGVDQQNVERAIDHYLRTDETFTLASGMTVVLTGDHPTLSKQELASRVSVLGLFEGKGVTKKTDLLAAVDPLSPSGKAKKARQYEIPIVAVDDLLAAAPGGSVPVVTTTSSSLKVVTCSQCDKTWTASARSAGRAETVCDECR